MADLVESLMNATGVVAVARAAGATADTERARGEPSYLVYYHGSLEAGEIRGLGFEGEVSEPGAWGRLLNGAPRSRSRDSGSRSSTATWR